MSSLRDLAKDVCKLVTGLLLMPAVISLVSTLFDALGPGMAATWSSRQRGWVAGLGAYAALHLVFWRPQPVVKVGHGFVRRFFGLFFGEQVVPVEEGEGIAKEPTTLVTFSAYFVPVYTIIWTLVVRYLPRYVPWTPSAYWVCFWLAVTLLMHLLISLEDAQESRGSVRVGGYLVTIGLMLLANALVLAVCLHLLFDDVAFFNVVEEAARTTGIIYQSAWQQLFGA